MILDSATEEIRAYLGGAVATTEPEFFSSFTDVNDEDAGAVFQPRNLSGVTTGAAPVVLVDSPATDIQRQIRYLSVYNLDTAPVVVHVEKHDAGDQVPLLQATLQPDEVLIYQTDVGWTLYSSSGVPVAIVSPLTTKGDIWGYDTADARIPVGADGEVLVADSTQTLGVDWRPVPRPVLVTTAVAFAASPYAVLDADDVILVDATLGNVEVDLPAAGSHAGRLLRVKKIDASVNTVTIDPSGAELLDGAANLVLALQHEVAGFVSDGTEWWIV